MRITYIMLNYLLINPGRLTPLNLSTCRMNHPYKIGWLFARRRLALQSSCRPINGYSYKSGSRFREAAVYLLILSDFSDFFIFAGLMPLPGTTFYISVGSVHRSAPSCVSDIDCIRTWIIKAPANARQRWRHWEKLLNWGVQKSLATSIKH